LRLERVVAGRDLDLRTSADAENSMRELAALAETAGSEVLDGVLQRRQAPDPGTFLGSGKAQELRAIVEASGADTVICDGELAPSQRRSLEDVVKVKVIDRTALILDIFAQHASPRKARPRSSWPQMEYLLPRCVVGVNRCPGRPVARSVAPPPGWDRGVPVRRRSSWTGGGSATGWSSSSGEIALMKKARVTKRDSRLRNCGAVGRIAGYTNAGKSSLLNRLTGAGVLVENAPVRHPGPDRAPGGDPGRARVHPRRHRRFRPAVADPAGGGVPLHAGRGFAVGSGAARR
jgi:GTP-binding protein HflX